MIADRDTLFAEALSLSDDSRLLLVERLIPTIKSEVVAEEKQAVQLAAL